MRINIEMDDAALQHFHKCLETYGMLQEDIAFEEMGELARALVRKRRQEVGELQEDESVVLSELLEEMADVIIMVMQAYIIHFGDRTELLRGAILGKLIRQQHRLEGGARK